MQKKYSTYMTLTFKKTSNCIRRILARTTESGDHNIDPLSNMYFIFVFILFLIIGGGGWSGLCSLSISAVKAGFAQS
jgi:hypothetical protein